ncbi:hypothetical protein [Nocardia sp. NPDC052566]|uniref:hypothetical protein n=1 Tax=Nocardia sp. NPDC052566 TaxID=3364330 RepID=UPI0037C750DE
MKDNVSDYVYRAVRRMLLAEELTAVTTTADDIAFAEAASASGLEAWAADE